MHYYSTRNKNLKTPLKEALFNGLAPDKGLYMPEKIPVLTRKELESVRSTTLAETGKIVTRKLFGEDVPLDVLDELTTEALNFETPLVKVADQIYSLELFHGPTLAFKDVGARFMARLLGYFVEDSSEELHVLVATSGDTGSAVANGFLGVKGIRVHVLYPSGKVSKLQEKQFTTLGGNITALEVDGSFDDCQSLVKSAFSDQALRQKMALTSANSINLARFLPQSIYYLNAWGQLNGSDHPDISGQSAGVVQSTNAGQSADPVHSADPVQSTNAGQSAGVVQSTNAGQSDGHDHSEAKVRSRKNRDLVFAVPSGNYGNLTAGLVAREMGMPVHTFLAASNANDVVPEYLSSGSYTPRPSVSTIANAMDVGAPSNFERILDLFDGEHQRIVSHLKGYSYSDDDIRKIISTARKETGYLLDTHGATGYASAQTYLESHPDATVVFLETAHPAKFGEEVEKATGEKVEIPERLAEFADREKKSIPVGKEYGAFREYLTSIS